MNYDELFCGGVRDLCSRLILSSASALYRQYQYRLRRPRAHIIRHDTVSSAQAALARAAQSLSLSRNRNPKHPPSRALVSLPRKGVANGGSKGVATAATKRTQNALPLSARQSTGRRAPLMLSRSRAGRPSTLASAPAPAPGVGVGVGVCVGVGGSLSRLNTLRTLASASRNTRAHTRGGLPRTATQLQARTHHSGRGAHIRGGRGAGGNPKPGSGAASAGSQAPSPNKKAGGAEVAVGEVEAVGDIDM
jgi:hypothetical protein